MVAAAVGGHCGWIYKRIRKPKVIKWKAKNAESLDYIIMRYYKYHKMLLLDTVKA